MVGGQVPLLYSAFPWYLATWLWDKHFFLDGSMAFPTIVNIPGIPSALHPYLQSPVEDFIYNSCWRFSPLLSQLSNELADCIKCHPLPFGADGGSNPLGRHGLGEFVPQRGIPLPFPPQDPAGCVQVNLEAFYSPFSVLPLMANPSQKNANEREPLESWLHYRLYV